MSLKTYYPQNEKVKLVVVYLFISVHFFPIKFHSFPQSRLSLRSFSPFFLSENLVSFCSRSAKFAVKLPSPVIPRDFDSCRLYQQGL